MQIGPSFGRNKTAHKSNYKRSRYDAHTQTSHHHMFFLFNIFLFFFLLWYLYVYSHLQDLINNISITL